MAPAGGYGQGRSGWRNSALNLQPAAASSAAMSGGSGSSSSASAYSPLFASGLRRISDETPPTSPSPTRSPTTSVSSRFLGAPRNLLSRQRSIDSDISGGAPTIRSTMTAPVNGSSRSRFFGFLKGGKRASALDDADTMSQRTGVGSSSASSMYGLDVPPPLHVSLPAQAPGRDLYPPGRDPYGLNASR